MEDSLKMNIVDSFNPWSVGNLEEFHYYCCPECDERNHSKEIFLQHAITHHPRAKEYLFPKIEIKLEPKEEVLIECTPEVECEYNENSSFTVDNTQNTNTDYDFAEIKCDYFCNKCNEDFSSLIALKKHMVELHNIVDPHSHLNSTLNSKSLIKKHSNKKKQGHTIDSKEKMLIDKAKVKCKYCEIVFNSFGALNDHVKIYHGYKCEKCSEMFPSKYKLKVHLTSVHESLEKESFQCDKCGDTFTTKISCNKHVKRFHEGLEKNLHCDQCDFVTYYKSYLNNHIKNVHEGDKHKTCTCDRCGKTFKYPYKLREHVSAVHEGLKKYQCDQCGYRTGFNKTLRKHVLAVHEGLKNYQCDICSRAFFNNDKLKRHIITVHEKLKNFKCTYCTKAYGQSGDLNKHIKNVHR